MKTYTRLLLFLFALFLCSCGDKERNGESSSPTSAMDNKGEKTDPVDDSILGDGLQATLKLAAERAIEELGKPGGFADNEALRIQLPESFSPAKSILTKIGQEQLLNDFEDSLNEAARKSVMASPKILADTINGMEVGDVVSLWRGGKDAATRYLETHTRNQIEEQMLPIISKQTNASGATKYFKQIVDLIPKEQDGWLGSLASFAGFEIPDDFDLDRFVSDKALDGLYATLAAEEARIRENPAARTTELVKSAFEYFSRK